jgi:hypothetical protein
MRDLLLYASGILGLAAASLHSVLGETRVFARVRIEPERLRTLIRLVWHCSVVAWAAVAVLLIAAPFMGSPAARYWIVGAAVVVFGFAAIASLGHARALLRLGRVDGCGRPGDCRIVRLEVSPLLVA